MKDNKRNITMAINDRCASSGCYEGDVYVEVFDNEKEIDADYAKK